MTTSRQPLLGADGVSLSDALTALDPGAQPVGEERLSGRVRRVALIGGRRSSVVVKQVDRVTARKTELLSSRWLPAVGLRDHGPPLLSSPPGPGDSAWQVFEDLGDCALHADRPEPGGLKAAADLVARLHLAFAESPLLREWVDELGALGDFYADWTLRAARALETIGTSGLSPDRFVLRDRLSRRVELLLDEEPERTRRLEEDGWPLTLLHGDLWPQNVLLPEGDDGRRARLIDWDQAAAGPVVYDISTFVSRFSPPARIPALRLYERAIDAAGWRLPDPAELNYAFETAEYARLASCLISPAEAAGEGAEWGFEELREIDSWFAELRPVLPVTVR